MTTTQQDDLQFVRQMTEASNKAPLLGGRFYVFWGVLVAIGFVCHWAIASENFGLPPVSYAILWSTFMVFGAIGMPFLIRGIRRKPGLGAIGNRAEEVVWTTGGYSVFAYAAGTVVAVIFADGSYDLFDLILAVAFGSYGVAFMVTGTMANEAWMRVPGVASLVACGLVPVLVGKPVLYLVAAATIVVVSVIPGLILLRNEPASLEEAA